MISAGLIEVSYVNFPSAYQVRVTNDGFDWLASVRDKDIWQRTKRVVEETGGNFTVEMTKTVAKGLIGKLLDRIWKDDESEALG
jgi:hypothetical protein